MKQKLNSVLLIDDDAATNFINSFLLKQMDCTEQIIVKENARAGLDYLKQAISDISVPDLIFLDINMPGMDGWDFVAEYQKFPRHTTSSAALIMLSTSQNPDDLEKANQIREIAQFQSKPLSKEKMNAILHQFFPDLYLRAM